MNRILAFTLVFLLILPVNLAWGQSDEGYGEDETALGQFVDSFETSGNISVAVNVIQNSTLEVMELNYSLGGSLLENFTDYTEVDTGNNRVVVQSDIWVSHLAFRDEDTYLYYDYGTDYFDDFVHQVVFEGDYGDVFGLGYVWAVADGIDDFNGIDTASGNALGLRIYRSATQRLITLVEIDGGTAYATSFNFLTANTKYYANISKDDLALVAKIYDDSAMTNLITTLSLTLHTDHKLEIIYAVNTHNDANPDMWMNTDVYNLSIGRTSSGYSPSGYFSTTDYLNNPLANGSALVLMVNTSIPANTDIQLQFSNDTVVWTDHEGVPGDSVDLLGGFESIDLRMLNHSNAFHSRFNLSTSDISITPRVYQNRLITMVGQGAGPGGTVNELNGTWVYYNLTAIANITGVHDEGFLNSTYFIDGDTWNCSEVVGAPGYIVNFNVTGIDTEAISLWLVNYVYYDGINAHHIHVEAWNFTAPGWVEIGLIDDDVGFEWHNYTVYEMRIPNDFVNSTGAFVGRFNHITAGNINDDIVFDRISLLAFVPTGLAVAGVGAGANWGLLWFFLILICVPIALVLWRGSKR